MKQTILIATLVAFLFAIQFAHAGSVITVVDSVDANGSIGLYIRNELGITIFTDNTQESTNVLSFSVNGTNVSVSDRSDLEIPRGFTRFVVLNKEWPSGGYYKVDITYADASGGLYPKETHVLFAKIPLTIEEITIEPAKILSNVTRVVYKAKVRATGEAAVSNINFNLASNPKYYIISDSKVPGGLSAGATADMQLTFDRDGQSFPDTVIYTTTYIPFEFTYTTMGFGGTQSFNDSFVIYNSVSSVNQAPSMNGKITVPASAEPGQTVSVPVYAWNTNVGGNSACNLNLTLTSNSSSITIPTPMISSSEEFKGRVIEPDSPTATFEVSVSDSAASGNYELALEVSFIDCAWKGKDFIVKRELLYVAKSGEPVIKEEPVEPPVNETPKEPIVNISVKEPSVETQAIGGLFVVVIAIVGVLVLFGLVYFLEFRSRTVY